MQNRHIDGGDISFGPFNGSLAELAGLEELVSSRLRNGAYRSYDDDEWSLALELSAYLCLPERRSLHELDFTIQVRCSLATVFREPDPINTGRCANGASLVVPLFCRLFDSTASDQIVQNMHWQAKLASHCDQRFLSVNARKAFTTSG